MERHLVQLGRDQALGGRLEPRGGPGHGLVAQVQHAGQQELLGRPTHLPTPVLQALVQLGQAGRQLRPRHRPPGHAFFRQPPCQPAKQLRGTRGRSRPSNGLLRSVVRTLCAETTLYGTTTSVSVTDLSAAHVQPTASRIF